MLVGELKGFSVMCAAVCLYLGTDVWLAYQMGKPLVVAMLVLNMVGLAGLGVFKWKHWTRVKVMMERDA